MGQRIIEGRRRQRCLPSLFSEGETVPMICPERAAQGGALAGADALFSVAHLRRIPAHGTCHVPRPV